MILCSPQPAPIIKAALVALISGDLPCLKGEEDRLGLFGLTEARDVDGEPLPALLNSLSSTCGLRAGWLQGSPGGTLRRLVAANLRYSAPDRGTVIFAAVEEAIVRGPAYSFSGIGNVSRLFASRYRAVSHEIHKMLGFIRFHPGPDGALIARPKLFHNTADLILRQFAPRYPGTRLIFLLPDRALALSQGALSTVSAGDYASFVDEDPFTAAWEKYYRSQYIETRKNMTLAQRCVPKKYWDWLAEGGILAAEAQK